MCTLCSPHKEIRDREKAEIKELLLNLEVITSMYQLMLTGRIKPHTNQLLNMRKIVNAATKKLFADFGNMDVYCSMTNHFNHSSAKQNTYKA